MAEYSIRGLSFSYPEQDRLVLNDINLEIQSGEFIVLCGPSGSGKTTLLRQLKTVLAPHGAKVGEILFKGKNLDDIGIRQQSSEIGFVMQSPENQIVTDKVWHELAFGLESLGYDTPTIRLRVSEMASFFGIQNWFYKDVTDLSGGQKQLLNLAAIMAMQPSVLILDEPTSQLDPIAASDFLATISKINRELGTTIILTEHRLEEAFPMCDRAIVMDKGKVITDGAPKDVGQELDRSNNSMFYAMPIPMRIHSAVENNLECPVTVREGRRWLEKLSKNREISEVWEVEDKREEEKNKNIYKKLISSFKSEDTDKDFILQVKNIWFKYEKDLPDVVKNLSFNVERGEFLSILGGNGTGKSTTLSLISGINRPYRGEIILNNKSIGEIEIRNKFKGLLGVLPQNPQALFVKKTVREDLYEVLKDTNLSKEEKYYKVGLVSKLCQLENLLDQHPYDLSGGEQQRAGLAKVLLLEPKLLLLDEPTKGLDAEFKREFAGILNKLLEMNVTIVMVSHDIEFCAKYSTRCALFFDGNIVTSGSPREFFTGNSFYTTSANRMARSLLDGVVTSDDVILACGGKPEAEPEIDFDYDLDKNIYKEDKQKKKTKLKKYIVGLISFISLVFIFIKGYPIFSGFAWSMLTGSFKNSEIEKVVSQKEYLGLVIGFIISALALFLSVFDKGEKVARSEIQVPVDKRKISKRTALASFLILLIIPLTIFIGSYYLEDRKYYFISLLIIIEVMLPFIMIFESRKPKARELVVIAVLCALGVAGRAAFFMIPQFKPVAAIAIISAVAFGAESGFLVGALSMFLSNFLYGQGPLTPWQMFAMGIIGFLAGIFFRKGFLRRDRLSLSIFGGVVVFLVYGGIMNPAFILSFQENINFKMIMAAYATGVPFDLIHAAGTVFFLMVGGEPMLEKLDRIKVKYGLVE